MKGILYKSEGKWMVKYTTYKTIPGIKGVMGSHSRIPESNYIPLHPDHILHYIKDGDEFTTIDFEKVQEECGVYKDYKVTWFAKLINEEKNTKRSKQKRACTQDIVDEAMRIASKDVRAPKCVRDGIVKRMYTEEDLLDAMSFAECYIVEHDRPLFLKSDGKPTPDCLNYIKSIK